LKQELFDVVDRKVLALLRGLFERGGSPERLARGFAAGVMGAFFPSSVLRFVAAFLAALFFRGNKAASLAMPTLAGIIEGQIILKLETGMAASVWPHGDRAIHAGAVALHNTNLAWNWLHPLHSLQAQFETFGALSAGAAAALLGAALVLGFLSGALTYPATLIALTFFYDAKIRTQQYIPWGAPKRPAPFEIPPALPAPERSGSSVLLPEELSGGQLRERYCGNVREFFDADSVRLLIDGGQAYPEMLAAIASARETLVLETYILRGDKFGWLFADALRSAARRGVNTRVIYDGVGSMNLPEELVRALIDDGVQVRVYHPLSGFWRGGMEVLQRRDHRKIIVADRHVSLLGGLNIADEYAAVGDGGGGWRDTHVRLDGAAAARILTKIFDESWRAAEPVKLANTAHVKPGPARAAAKAAAAVAGALEPVLAAGTGSGGNARGPTRETATTGSGVTVVPAPSASASRVAFTSSRLPTEILSNRELLKRMRIKRAYLRAFKAAQRYILIENAFFIPDRDVLRALYAATRRGVVVGVVVAMKHDVRIAALASRALYDELLVHGVRLFEFPISMIHSKVAAIDDRWAIVSSYNLNNRSLLHDLEVGALFFDEKFAVAMRDQILEDISKCNEISKELHRARPWNIALTESICYQFRYWL